MIAQFDQSQTRFSLEKPLFEQMGQIPIDEPENPVPKVPLLKQKKFIILLIAGITVLILVILFIVNAYISQQKKVHTDGTPEETEAASPGSSEPLKRRIDSAQKELKDADPSQQDLVYPTMDYQLRLDSKKER